MLLLLLLVFIFVVVKFASVVVVDFLFVRHTAITDFKRISVEHVP